MSQLITDLHVHLAGALTPDDIIAVAEEHDLLIDDLTAQRVGITRSTPDQLLSANDLTTLEKEKMKQGMQVKKQQQNLFEDLDNAYANRSFVTKNPSVFPDLLKKIAQNYQKQGVEYAELSYAGILSNPELIRAIHEHMPDIEQDTGVKLRFLGALWRHSDIEWNEDEVDRAKKILKSPYVVGIDVMGHEKNPIRELKKPLQDIVAYAAQHVPGFQIHIHGGENPYLSADPDQLDDYTFNNVHEAVVIVEEAKQNCIDQKSKRYVDQIQTRIGHGRFGIHEKTLDLMQRLGVFSECCLSSNLLLNCVSQYMTPFNDYDKKNVSYVIATDGGGMYPQKDEASVSIPSELAHAFNCGLTLEQLLKIQTTERNVIDKDKKRFTVKTKLFDLHTNKCVMDGIDVFTDMADVNYETATGKPRWSYDIVMRNNRLEAETITSLITLLENAGINCQTAEWSKLLEDKKLILFSGASKSSWRQASPEQQDNIRKEMEAFIAHKTGREYVFMTGGTNYGFEGMIHELVQERNLSLQKTERISVIGALAKEARPDEITEGTISHALILKLGDDVAKTWMDQPQALLDLVQKHDGVVVMAGGGQVIRDMICDANQRGMIDNNKIALFNNVNGASAENARIYPQASVSSAQDLDNLLLSPLPQSLPPQSRPRSIMPS